MESLQIKLNPLQHQTHFMSSVSPKLSQLRFFCSSSLSLTIITPQISRKASSPRGTVGFRSKASDAQLKENWLDSLSCPFPQVNHHFNADLNADSDWVLGVDPDVSGALALLKTDDTGCSAQVHDSPRVQVVIGKRVRRRLDAKSIVQLLRSFDAPLGTTAYIEQSNPYPQDGKQGWWSGGFGYGLWIGILVALGFSVVPVTSMMWKNKFELSGSTSSKDDSRRVASELFPSLSPLLKRKKDHGRAEALLIAAYGKGQKTGFGS